MAVAVAAGVQSPRVMSVPESVGSAGREALELCEMAGLVLDPWEALVLEQALGERADGRWAAFEVGLVVPRQNGKGAVLEARELAGLFLIGERLIIHSAHQFDTSLEAFRRLLFLIEETPDLERRVRRVSRSHGEEGIELKGGQRIRFRTRTKGGGRGFSGDLLVLDEAMMLPETAVGAILPVVSARPNPQVWYTGSAVDQTVHEDGVVLARVRERGLSGSDPSLAYFEWSAVPDDWVGERPFRPDDVDERMAGDLEVWGRANPALGIRIDAEYVASERRAMDPRTFAVERLCVGDWPRLDGGEQVISSTAWEALTDPMSTLADPVCVAYDVTPDRAWASVAAAGLRPDGLAHVEVTDRRRGTGWLPARVAEIAGRHDVAGVVCDAAGPAGSLIAELAEQGVEVTAASAKDHARACGMLFDRVEQRRLRHLGSGELAAAVKGATRRPLGDAWAWSRRTSAVDISPLVAATLALWGSATLKRSGWKAV